MSFRFWIVTNRTRDDDLLTSDRGPLTYWVATEGDPTWIATKGDRTTPTTWKRVGATAFRTPLSQAPDDLGVSVSGPAGSTASCDYLRPWATTRCSVES
jgi:hypothetical protein